MSRSVGLAAPPLSALRHSALRLSTLRLSALRLSALRLLALPLGALLLSACGSEPSAPARLEEGAADSRARVLREGWAGPREGDGALLVLLHGYGAPGDDMASLAQRVRAETGARVVYPAAPLPMGRGRAWWPIEAGPRPADYGAQRPDGLAEASRDVIAMLERLRAEGRLEPAQTVLAGFSQGAMLATEVALSWGEAAAALGVLSGAPVDERRWRTRLAERAPARVLFTHGRRDPLLSFDAAERLARHFEQAGSSTEFVAFDGPHTIPPQAVDALVELVRAVGE